MKNNTDLYKTIQEFFAKHYELFPTTGLLLGIEQENLYRSDPFDKDSISDHVRYAKDLLQKLPPIEEDATSDEKIDHHLFEANLRAIIRQFEQIAYYEKNPVIYTEVIFNGINFILSEKDDQSQKEQKLKNFLISARQTIENCQKNTGKITPQYGNAAINSIKGGRTLLAYLDAHHPTVKDEVKLINESLTELETDIVSKIDPAKADCYLGQEAFKEYLENEFAEEINFDKILATADMLIEQYSKEIAKYNKKQAGSSGSGTLTLKSPEDIFALYDKEVGKVLNFLETENILDLSGIDFKMFIEKTPKFKESTTPFAACIPPKSFAKEQVGSMLLTVQEPVNMEVFMNFHRSYKYILIHEAIPGHFLQRVLNNNLISPARKMLTGIDWFVEKKQLKTNLFCEGWAVYMEDLFREKGYMTSDEEIIDGLRFQLWRALRLKIETSLQTGKMTFEEACELLMKHLGRQYNEAKKEVEYHLTTFSQATTYMWGKVQIEEIKKTKYKDLSDKEFHKTLLSLGSVPMSLVNQYANA